LTWAAWRSRWVQVGDGDGEIVLGQLGAGVWPGGTELRWTDTGAANARDVVVASTRLGPSGRLGVGGDEGDVEGKVMSGRASGCAGDEVRGWGWRQ
jgi:hypothetical protein